MYAETARCLRIAIRRIECNTWNAHGIGPRVLVLRAYYPRLGPSCPYDCSMSDCAVENGQDLRNSEANDSLRWYNARDANCRDVKLLSRLTGWSLQILY